MRTPDIAATTPNTRPSRKVGKFVPLLAAAALTAACSSGSSHTLETTPFSWPATSPATAPSTEAYTPAPATRPATIDIFTAGTMDLDLARRWCHIVKEDKSRVLGRMFPHSTHGRCAPSTQGIGITTTNRSKVLDLGDTLKTFTATPVQDGFNLIALNSDTTCHPANDPTECITVNETDGNARLYTQLGQSIVALTYQGIGSHLEAMVPHLRAIGDELAAAPLP